MTVAKDSNTYEALKITGNSRLKNAIADEIIVTFMCVVVYFSNEQEVLTGCSISIQYITKVIFSS